MTDDRRPWRPLDRLPAAVTTAAGALFATGVGSVPHSPVESLVYDLVLFNVVPLGTTVLCWRAGRRVPAERIAWWAVGTAWALSVVGNLLFGSGPSSASSFPSLADLAYLAAYPLIGLHLLALVHVRVPRFRPSTWLDGVIGGLGVTAVVTTFVLSPWLDRAGLEANAATLTYPVVDVLLLALVAGVIAIRGLHSDRTMLLISVALVSKLVGDVLLTRALAQDSYLVGGPTDLCWVVAALVTGAAAALAMPERRDQLPDDFDLRTGWRTLALPLTCNLGSLLVLGREFGDPSASVGEVTALGCLLASLVRTAVTFQEVRSLHEMRRQAATDDLTGLPNRRTLLLHVGSQLRTGRPVSLLLLDLDGFKAVNDGLGHHAGDQLLQELGGRIRPALRPADVLARLGGDEFAVLLPGLGIENARECAVRIHELVCRPVTITGVTVCVGASIGVVSAPEQASDVTDLLRRADAAMYAAKSRRGGVRVYTPDLESGRRNQPGFPVEAAGEKVTELRFRPLTLADGGLAGAEGVVRGAADSIEHRSTLPVLHEMLEAAAGWASEACPVWAALSSEDLTNERLPDHLSAALLRTGVPARALVVRLRHLADQHASGIGTALASLRTRGVRTAVDVSAAGPLTVLGLGTVVVAEGTDEPTSAWLSHRGCEIFAGEAAVLTGEEVSARLAVRGGHSAGLALASPAEEGAGGPPGCARRTNPAG